MWDIVQFDIEEQPKFIIKFGRPYPCLGSKFPCCHYDRQRAIEIGSLYPIEVIKIGSPPFNRKNLFIQKKWLLKLFENECYISWLELFNLWL
jgi:hypothetical protein